MLLNLLLLLLLVMTWPLTCLDGAGRARVAAANTGTADLDWPLNYALLRLDSRGSAAAAPGASARGLVWYGPTLLYGGRRQGGVPAEAENPLVGGRGRLAQRGKGRATLTYALRRLDSRGNAAAAPGASAGGLVWYATLHYGGRRQGGVPAEAEDPLVGGRGRPAQRGKG